MKIFTQVAKDNNFLYTELVCLFKNRDSLVLRSSLIPVITCTGTNILFYFEN